MNDDTINRQAAVDAVDEMSYAFNVKTNAHWALIKALAKLPPAERRGRWKGAGMGDYNCSLCGHLQSGKTNYCPNCGADMREAKNGCDDCFIPMFYNLEDDDSICRDCEEGE